MRHISKTTLATLFNALVAVVCLFAFFVGQANAVWYEATGQAAVLNGDKEQAKREATQEALKQAMLFAGASVHSVAKLTNGLLKNEELTISSTGEVEQLELVSETYNGDFVTVNIRADIFPKGKVCKAQYDKKHFATTLFRVKDRTQLTQGNIPNFDSSFTQRLAHAMRDKTENLSISYIAPTTTKFDSRFTEQNVRTLSAQSNTQYVLVGIIDDLSVTYEDGSFFAPWKDATSYRAFAMSLQVYDGINGGLLLTNSYQGLGQWTFDKFEDVDENSASFWKSQYGRAVDEIIEEAIDDIKEATSCQPVTGRVINVARENISVSLGRDNGISENDELFLYQSKEVIDNRGRKYLQYTLFPGRFVVSRAFGNSSLVKNESTGIIANIQEHDFVVKK
ncbi:flagellar assembly protein T N-terminal domain-containing protein [Alteromonas gracilis]|uniref:flagellar assembly protein T N-terminal domain-containing protein n=1 Tax=Alteromonas gracilis TaxID=1479524 RepID=UPI003736D5D5